jgi:branched-subunit amino acid aminotransferase/4-amino-4-deoxychorismate lyase
MFLVSNGQLLNREEARVPVYDPALFADFRIYETLRIESGQVIFLQDHIDRIFQSARIIEMNLGHTPVEIGDWIARCVAANRTQEGIYRVIIHGDVENNRTSQVYIYPESFRQLTPQEREEGVAVITFAGQRIYPGAKSISRLTQFRASRAASRAGAYEAILIGDDDTVHEGVRTNVFMVKDGKLVTPSLDTVLPGIRRRRVIELAKQAGIPVEERRVVRQELFEADEVFLTSTIMELAPVRRIDRHQLSSVRPIYSKLSWDFRALKQSYLYEKTAVN